MVSSEAPNRIVETQVLIVGARPVGLTLALDLGRRGVRCLLIERSETSIQLPKMERCNARTMEIYRRLGIAEQVRDGTALHDHFGLDYTLLQVGETNTPTAKLQECFQELRFPLDLLESPDQNGREIYDCDLLLVRPDLHIAWRGNRLPVDVAKLALIATGRL